MITDRDINIPKGVRWQHATGCWHYGTLRGFQRDGQAVVLKESGGHRIAPREEFESVERKQQNERDSTA